MSVYYNLEFYIKRQPLSKELLERVFSALQKNGMTYHYFWSNANDIKHFFEPPVRTTKDWSFIREAENKLSDEEKIIRILADEGAREFGVWFGIGNEDFDAYIAIRNNGHTRKGEYTKEALQGCLYGGIVVRWEELSDSESRKVHYANTIEIIPDLYEAIHPIYGFGCDEELQGEQSYNLKPSEENIAKYGPRDLLDINVWSPEIAGKIDLSKLKEEKTVSIRKFPDGGVLINHNPEEFPFGHRMGGLKRMEKALGWYRAGRSDARGDDDP